MFDIGFDHPDPWPHGNLRDGSENELVVGQDRLAFDLCICGDHVYIRGLIRLPLQGSDQSFHFGTWCSLHVDTFRLYVNHGWDPQARLDPVFGWMCNTLPGYPCSAAPVETQVQHQNANQRPQFAIQDARSSLGTDQSDGITFDRLLDIYAASGQDLRPHLPPARPI